MTSETQVADAVDQMNRIAELEDAIRKHRDTFVDEPLQAERELWSVLKE